jgi:hypothetical protein
VLFQSIPGAFHIDILPGRQFGAEVETYRGTSQEVLNEASLINSFQIRADGATHRYTSPAFCRKNRNLDAAVV